MNFKQYNLILTLPLLTVFALVYGLALAIEPLNGDLTRLGPYLESEFGWNQPQEQFSHDLYINSQDGKYDQYHDIVIVGDSFSTINKPYQWQNYLAKETGLKVITYDQGNVKIENLIASEQFKRFPPKIFIRQFAERFIPSHSSKGREDCRADPTPPIGAVTLQPLDVAVLKYERPRSTSFFQPNFNESAYYIKYLFKRYYDLYIAVHFNRLPKVIRLPLNNDRLFTSRNSDEILLFRGDIRKVRQFKKPMIRKWACWILEMQNRIQRNGKTFFVAMPVPDKTTAYAEYIEFENDKNINLVELIIQNTNIHMFRLDTVMKEKIREGVRDLYLPNDTHWGYRGHRLAAETLIHYLEEEGVFKRSAN